MVVKKVVILKPDFGSGDTQRVIDLRSWSTEESQSGDRNENIGSMLLWWVEENCKRLEAQVSSACI